MRTIKFRGQRADNGDWVYGYLADGNFICRWSEGHVSMYEVKATTVCQFTGLHDAKGNPIYEGDIIKGEREYMHLIRYDEERAQFTATGLQYIDDRIFDKMNAGNVYQSWIDEFQKVVVGNKYDNSELMKGKGIWEQM